MKILFIMALLAGAGIMLLLWTTTNNALCERVTWGEYYKVSDGNLEQCTPTTERQISDLKRDIRNLESSKPAYDWGW